MKQLWITFLGGIALSASTNLINAQPNYPVPSGVWCSCPPTTGTGNGSVDPAVASKSYVNGILVRAGWKDIETADDTYNWALIDSQLASAKAYGKKISLAIGGGPNSPAWLYAQGAQSISYTVPFSGTIPVPWDTLFLTRWTSFITALGNRYANDTTIRLVYITNASGNGFEMQLPFNPTPSYADIAYTDQKMIDSWKRVVDTFSSAFPHHYLTNDFHPVNSGNSVADSVYAHAKLHIGGNRYGANGWWWTQNNTSLYASQYSILQSSAAGNAFTGIQMAYSGTASAGSFGTGGMPAALNLAISNHICYWEIWNDDITSGNFDTLFSNATCLHLGVAKKNGIETSLTIFPNPSPRLFTITLQQHTIHEIEVLNELGQHIFRDNTIQTNSYLLDMGNAPEGIYLLKVTDYQKAVSYRKLVLKNQ